MQHPSIPSGCHTLWYNPFLSYWIILWFYELDIDTQAMTQLPYAFCRSHGSNFQTSCLAASSIQKSCSIITRLAGGPHVYEEVSHQPKKKKQPTKYCKFTGPIFVASQSWYWHLGRGKARRNHICSKLTKALPPSHNCWRFHLKLFFLHATSFRIFQIQSHLKTATRDPKAFRTEIYVWMLDREYPWSYLAWG